MLQKNAVNQHPSHASKAVMVMALILALCLPFLLVKWFPHPKLTIVRHPPKNIIYTRPVAAEPPPGIPAPHIAQTIAAQTQQASARTSTTQQQAAPQPDKTGLVTVTTRPGDSLALLFKRLGLPPGTLQQLLQDVPAAKALARIKLNQTFQFYIHNHQLDKLIAPYAKGDKMVIVRKGEHFQKEMRQGEIQTYQEYITATVHGSLFATAKRQRIPYQLVQQMIQIFAWEINFRRDVHDGDQFTILYKASYSGKKLLRTGDILAVSFHNNGKLHTAIRHTAKGTGQTDYFTPQGMSAQKAFDRYPLRFSHISSTFSLSRYHPVLHYSRAHHGVDLAARIGTPIQATGSGRIAFIGRQGGYGNVVKINHAQGYSTVYGHMLRFQKGLSRGSAVRRGQIIGYVGQTGLASGPHCHYELRVHDQPKNPSTIQLPRSIPLSGRELAAFKAKASQMIAHMRAFERKKMLG